jgi:hypothetical protein
MNPEISSHERVSLQGFRLQALARISDAARAARMLDRGYPGRALARIIAVCATLAFGVVASRSLPVGWVVAIALVGLWLYRRIELISMKRKSWRTTLYVRLSEYKPLDRVGFEALKKCVDKPTFLEDVLDWVATEGRFVCPPLETEEDRARQKFVDKNCGADDAVP